jgi:hypothetical protein
MAEITNLPVMYITGCKLSVIIGRGNELHVSSGQLRDSKNSYDMVALSPLTISNTSLGINGVDTGKTKKNKCYNVFIIAASNKYQPTGAMISLSENPLLPYGYDLIRKIGYCNTNDYAEFVCFYELGQNSDRIIVFDDPVYILKNGNKTDFTTLDLSPYLPPIPNILITLFTSFTPQTAGNTFSVKPPLTSYLSFVDTGIVAGKEKDAHISMAAGLDSGKPCIDYRVTEAEDKLLIYLYSFHISL